MLLMASQSRSRMERSLVWLESQDVENLRLGGLLPAFMEQAMEGYYLEVKMLQIWKESRLAKLH